MGNDNFVYYTTLDKQFSVGLVSYFLLFKEQPILILSNLQKKTIIWSSRFREVGPLQWEVGKWEFIFIY